MLKSYILTSLRILLKDKLYTIINAAGLAVGLSVCFLIYSWVSFETSYDKHFDDSHNIYRVVTKSDDSSEPGIASTYPMVRSRVLSQFPEVEHSARIYDLGLLGSRTKVSHDDKVFTDNSFFYADADIFNVFSIRFISGNKSIALNQPNAAVVTQEMAQKFFGDEDPMGKTITVEQDQKFEVTGVVENIPANTHFHFDILASMQAHPWIKDAENSVWSGVVFHTYVKLKEKSQVDNLGKKISNFMDNFPNDPEGYGKTVDLRLQSIEEIHMNSNMRFELEANGNYLYVYLFVTIAILVMTIAVINYVNLATARHTQRLKEVAVRKVMGASRKQLITQLIVESVLIIIFAFFIAVLVIHSSQPVLISFSGLENLSYNLFQQNVLLTFLAITIIIGGFTGIVPALILSSLKPVKIFNTKMNTSSRGITIRKALVIFQFTISIILTICTAITYQQISYLREAQLGYDLDNIIVLNTGFEEIEEKYDILKSELMTNASISGVAATSQLPTDIQTSENIDLASSSTFGVNCISVDTGFFKVMNIQVKAGDDLISSLRVSDSSNYFVLNENALETIGWTADNALNEKISIRHGTQRPGSVVGVVSDFHFQSLHHEIDPLVLEFDPSRYQYLLVKIKPENMNNTLDFIAEKWKNIAGGIPFDYMFLDQQYDQLYKNEQRSSSLFIAFSVIAITISLLGLFGLSLFSVERRTKEIGLRKILGASLNSILFLLSKDFLVLLIISFLIAIPVGYYFMETWLSNFAFKTAINPGLFLLAGFINFLLALLTISYHSLKVSGKNPVETLKHE